MSGTPDNLYPLATALGVAIPLDVGKPKGAAKVNATTGSSVSLTLPDALNLVSVCFPSDIFLTAGEYFTPVTNSYQANAMYLVAGVLYDLLLPKTVTFLAVSKNSVGYVNVIQSWNQLQNSNYEVS